MSKLITIICLLICLMVLNTTVFAQDLAFTDAMGYGAWATGGRGGVVIKITTLNNRGATGYCQPGDLDGDDVDTDLDGGTQALNWMDAKTCSDFTNNSDCESGVGQCIAAPLGSLLRALSTERPRYIIPIVSGEIRSATERFSGYNHDDITLLGQSAYGDGIRITGGGLKFWGVDNIILRYFTINMAGGFEDEDFVLRLKTKASLTQALLFRTDTGQFEPEFASNIADTIIVDHATLEGAGDELLSPYGGTFNFTYQNSFNANGAWTVGTCGPEWGSTGDANIEETGLVTKRAVACKDDTNCTLSGSVDFYCDEKWANGGGHGALIGGNSGVGTTIGKDSYNHTFIHDVFAGSVRNPKVSGMFQNGSYCKGSYYCYDGSSPTGSNKVKCTTAANTCAAYDLPGDLAICEGACQGGYRQGNACTQGDTGNDYCGFDLCINNLCVGGWRNNEECFDGRECPIHDTNGVIDLINVFGSNGGNQQGEANMLNLGSTEQFSQVNVESSRWRRQNAPETVGNRLWIGDVSNDDHYYINDIVLDYEKRTEDGKICTDPVPNYWKHDNCLVNGDCSSKSCTFETPCPESLPCDSLTQTRLEAQNLTPVKTPPLRTFNSILGPTGTYVGVTWTAGVPGTGDVWAVADVDNNLLEPGVRNVGNNFPREHTSMTLKLDALWDGTATVWHCPWACPNSSGWNGGATHFNACPPPCVTGVWDLTTPAQQWYYNDMVDGFCASDGTTPCQCDDITTETGGACASTPSTQCSGGVCNIGVTSAGGLGGYYADADNDGIDDTWESTYCSVDGCTHTDPGCDGWINVKTGVADMDHLDCIEVFMEARIGAMTPPAETETNPNYGFSIIDGVIITELECMEDNSYLVAQGL